METTISTDPVLETYSTKPPDRPGDTSYELSDHGNALRLIDLYGEDIRYYDSNLGEGWYIWDGTTWCADVRGDIHQKAKITIDEMYAELPNISDRIEATKFLKFILHSKNQRALINMISSAQNEPGVFIDKERFDSHKDLVNVMNGVVDLRTGELHPHNKDLLLSKKIKYEYDPHAECPRWEQFVEEICHHDEIPEYLQRFFGYCLTGHTSEQMFVVANGLGGNGKGTMVDTIMNVFGPYVRTAEPSTVIKKKYERSSSNDLADLFGYRLVIASETDPDQMLDEGRVKRMTGEDRIKCRLLYREHFEYDPQFKLLLLTNHRPEIQSQDFSIWRRIKRIDFNQRFDENTADQQLRATLLQEAPGILRWIIDGAMSWYRGGLRTPQIVTDATGEYKEEMDVIGGFFDTCIKIDVAERASIKNLYDIYILWCKFIDEIPISKKAFSAKLGERGYEGKKSNGIVFRFGLTINEDILENWARIKEESGSKIPTSALSALFIDLNKDLHRGENSTDSYKNPGKDTEIFPDSGFESEIKHCEVKNDENVPVSMTQISGILNIIRTEWYSLSRPKAPLSVIDTFVGELIKRCQREGREIAPPAARVFVINAYTAWGWPTY